MRDPSMGAIASSAVNKAARTNIVISFFLKAESGGWVAPTCVLGSRAESGAKAHAFIASDTSHRIRSLPVAGIGTRTSVPHESMGRN